MWTFLLSLALAVEPAAQALDSVVLVVTGSSTCSGAVVDSSGRVATAYHCVASGGRPRVTTRSGKSAIGRVVGTDRYLDLAVIEVPELAGQPALVVRSEAPDVGEVVAALGHPYGVSAPAGFLEGTLRWSMSHGVVSAIGPQAIQFSAAVNPGNSGGPVVDEAGRVVAIVSRRTGGSEGLGFGARSEHLVALMEREPARMHPVGGSWGVFPMATTWASAGSLALGARAEVAVRDRVVFGGTIRWGLSPRWSAARFGATEFLGPAGRVGLRQRVGRGRFAVRADAWGEWASIQRLRARFPGDSVEIRTDTRWVPLVGGQLSLGISAFDFGCSPMGDGCAASLVIAWPGTIGVF